MSDKETEVPKSFDEAQSQHDAKLNANTNKVNSNVSVSTDEFNKLKDELEHTKAKAEDNWNRLLRKEADLRNAETRAKIEIERERKFALEKVFKELLTVLDSFQGGIESTKEEDSADKVREGMMLINTLLQDTLAKFGLEAINPVGVKFDPTMHEAMTMQETDEQEPNTVVTVIQLGYSLNGKVVRPARVIVAKAKSSS